MNYTKTLPPYLPSLFKRTRLFNLLDQNRNHQAIWVKGQPGAGKTTLVASYIKQCKVRSLWYQMDDGDDDPATFFHYFSLAAEDLLPLLHKPLPKLTPEAMPNLTRFARIFFRELFERLPKPLLLVFDNVQILPPDPLLNEIVTTALGEISRGINAIMISCCPPPPRFPEPYAVQPHLGRSGSEYVATHR